MFDDPTSPVLSDHFGPALARLGLRDDWVRVLVEVPLIGPVRFHMDPAYDALDVLKKPAMTTGNIFASPAHLY